MNDKVTAVIITGTPNEVSSLINNSFKNITNVRFITDISQQDEVKYKYHRPTRNYTFHDLDRDQSRVVNKFLANNSSFKFRDLVNHLRSDSRIYTPSNAAISNHLIDSNYSRYHNVTEGNKSFYSWEKN